MAGLEGWRGIHGGVRVCKKSRLLAEDTDMRPIAALVAIVIATGPAAANWQYTEWGQSLEEVLANEQVRQTTAEEQRLDSLENVGTALAAASYTASGIETEVRFLFRADRLSGVTLNVFDADDAMRIRDLIERELGPGRTRDDVGELPCAVDRQFWKDADVGQDVTYSFADCDPSPFAYVLYQSIPERGTSGF